MKDIQNVIVGYLNDVIPQNLKLSRYIMYIISQKELYMANVTFYDKNVVKMSQILTAYG